MVLDPLYLVVGLVSAGLSLLAQGWVKSAFARYSQIPNGAGMTGAQAAAEMLRREGVVDVGVERVDGWLSDHYDPSHRVIRLSPDVYDGRTIAAMGVACHEAGHALQHAQGYALLALRSWSVPMASLGGKFGPLLIMIGLAMSSLGMVKVGVALFACVCFFQLVTLPVELNASSRARLAIDRDGLARDGEESRGVARVLRAAAFTYVAAVATAILWLLYFLIRSGLLGGGRRSD